MKILFCPLNWGLGHASRDIPLIHRLAGRGHEVIIAADGPALALLKAEFPGLEWVRFRSSVTITYFRRLPAWMKVLLLSPFLAVETIREHFSLNRLVRRTGAGLVISDNRYGLWHSRIPSVLITHQLNPRLPRLLRFLELPLAGIIRFMVRQFRRCWVPDYPGGQNLSGDLSHKYTLPGNVAFIGPLSRFMLPGGDHPEGAEEDSMDDIPDRSHDPSPDSVPDAVPAEAELFILISGPEPQRSRLERIILEQVPGLGMRTVILQGLPGNSERKPQILESSPEISVYPHLPSRQVRALLENAKYIICRAGYSSIMDLITLGRTALIIPTPGQTEQEYLASRLSDRGLMTGVHQKSLDIKRAIPKLRIAENVTIKPGDDLLNRELHNRFFFGAG